MADDISIKVNLGGRMYPLSVEQSEEKQVRKAVEMVESDIRDLSNNYAVNDKQDLFAMVALKYAKSLLSDPSKRDISSNDFDIEEIHSTLSNYLETLA